MVVDGKGMFERADTYSVQGQTTHRTYTAEYTVNPDCTGFYDAQTRRGPVRSDFVIVGRGEELFVIRTNPGETLTFTFRKL
jgi:hypothetical protein